MTDYQILRAVAEALGWTEVYERQTSLGNMLVLGIAQGSAAPVRLPDWLNDLDAAMEALETWRGLAPKGTARRYFIHRNNIEGVEFTVKLRPVPSFGNDGWQVSANTLPRAICLAIIEAHNANNAV